MSLDDDPFGFEITKSGEVRIFRAGREVVVVRGVAAANLSARLGTSAASDQQVLARATGNYRRGNERR
ncbi:hypothetical protein I6E52_12145 [Salinibacterium sp. NG253]|uniref:hypothetical protein n=1 Tax=Salinibacterium sp. NG253 TaxID=2792039 RepID=UPI0018CE4FEB|nr:hypothetical protein [Salinibacterium sp. NG253]MBH0117591.1 hypothetical protein [Salinibacterium sp. NG253]